MPFILFYSSASEFLLAQEWGNLSKYLIYLVTLYVPAHVLPLKYGTPCNHKFSPSIFINLVMKEVEISSLTDSCGYGWKRGDQAIILHRLNCKWPQKQAINNLGCKGHSKVIYSNYLLKEGLTFKSDPSNPYMSQLLQKMTGNSG